MSEKKSVLEDQVLQRRYLSKYSQILDGIGVQTYTIIHIDF